MKLQEGHKIKGGYRGNYYQRLVAAMYRLTPNAPEDPEVREGYEQLWMQIVRQLKMARSDYEMRFSQEDPFASFKALKKSIDDQRKAGVRRPVITAYAPEKGLGPNADPSQKGHPFWNKQQDAIFGWVHDAMSHLKGNHPFTARGEYSAYLRHMSMMSDPETMRAGKSVIAKVLFTEVVGQTSYYYIYGDFPPQKAMILRDFDHYNIGWLAKDSPLNSLFVYDGGKKDLLPVPGISVRDLDRARPGLTEEWLTQERMFTERKSKPKFVLAQV